MHCLLNVLEVYPMLDKPRNSAKFGILLGAAQEYA